MIEINSVGQATIVEPSTELVHVGPLPPLTIADECDAACPAVARVRVRLAKTGTRLDLCKHHFERAEAALRPLCDAVLDQRGDLS